MAMSTHRNGNASPGSAHRRSPAWATGTDCPTFLRSPPGNAWPTGMWPRKGTRCTKNPMVGNVVSCRCVFRSSDAPVAYLLSQQKKATRASLLRLSFVKCSIHSTGTPPAQKKQDNEPISPPDPFLIFCDSDRIDLTYCNKTSYQSGEVMSRILKYRTPSTIEHGIVDGWMAGNSDFLNREPYEAGFCAKVPPELSHSMA